MKIQPLVPGNTKGLEDIAEALLNAKEQEASAPQKQGMIYVPSLDLYFTGSRILCKTKWQVCKDELKKQGMAMPTPYQFKEFLKYLKDSTDAKYNELFNEIAQVREPWRLEWLNARFEEKNGLYMICEDALVNGQLKTIEQKLDDVLMNDKTPGIDMNEWLNSSAKHGLPEKKIKTGSLWYYYPRSGRVAGFSANSDWVFLGCDRDPDYSNSALGVFGVREAPKK